MNKPPTIAEVAAETRRRMAACFKLPPNSIPAKLRKTIGGSDD